MTTPEARLLLLANSVILGAWALVLGILTIIGHDLRWSSPVYDVARLLPGAPESWGIGLVVGGILLLGGCVLRHAVWLTLGNLVCFTWTGMFGASVASVALSTETVSFGAAVTSWTFSLLFGFQLVYTWRHRADFG